MKYLKWCFSHWIELITSVVLFGFLYYLSMQTPLAGDDWAFYNNTKVSGVIDSALGMFYGWEGRLATLFSIHFIVDKKWLWNLFNPAMYVTLYWLTVQIVKPRYRVLHALFFVFILVSLKDNVRMEVLTWVTGSVYYGLPLLAAFLYFNYHFRVIKKNDNQISIQTLIFLSLLAFYLPLGMENIAIGSLIGTIALFIYHLRVHRNINKGLLISLIAMSLGYIIWLSSPGSDIRLSQMPDWVALNFFEKIMRNLPTLLNYTFYVNKYMILGLSTVMILYNIQNFKKRFWISFVAVYGFAILLVFSARLQLIFPEIVLLIQMADGYSVLNTIFWIVYALVFSFNVVWIDMMKNEFKLSLILIIVVFTNASLLMSPVIGYRLMVYSIVFLTLLTLMILNELRLHKGLIVAGSLGLLSLSLVFGRTLYYKYSVVAKVQNERELILEDYAVYSEFYKDGIWLPRFPIYSIHAGDIEAEDQYHMQAFKVFHNIPLDEKITFYWKDAY